MVGELEADAAVERWIQKARRWAAVDLIEQLAGHSSIDRVFLVAPDVTGLDDAPITDHIVSEVGRIHVGRALAEVVDTFRINKLLYFGGGSAPLLGDGSLGSLLSKLNTSQGSVITNNLHASDWAGIAPADAINECKERLPQDNMLGWVLSNELNLEPHAMPSTAEYRLDIDTPADLLMLKLHPMTKPRLRSFLDSLPLDLSKIKQALKVLNTPASHVFIAGRLSPSVWSALNRAFSSWIRVVSEERGMVSSGRQERGEVYSLLAEHISSVGIEGFIDTMRNFAQAAFIDTRVLLAHQRSWPSRSDRFHSDLGMDPQVSDEWLREFTRAVNRSEIPIILGGHGLLSGDMLALCELAA